MKRIGVGDPVPDFTVVTHTGQTVSLADFRGRQPLVLFFYPRDGTPVCTQEACGFRDAYEDFLAAGAAVLGVSGDSARRHTAFVQQHRLPFPLASDADGALRRAFGVPKFLGLFPGRTTYVIDQQGIVRHIVQGVFQAAGHIAQSLEIVRQLSA